MNEHAIYDVVGAKHQRYVYVSILIMLRIYSMRSTRPSLHGLRTRWCPEIVNLIEKMWAQEPSARPTMTEVVQELEEIVQYYR